MEPSLKWGYKQHQATHGNSCLNMRIQQIWGYHLKMGHEKSARIKIDTMGFNWPNMGFLSPIELHFDLFEIFRAAGWRSSRTARSTCSTRANRDGSSASASMQAAQTCLATAVASEFWWSQGSENRNSVGNEHKASLVWSMLFPPKW